MFTPTSPQHRPPPRKTYGRRSLGRVARQSQESIGNRRGSGAASVSSSDSESLSDTDVDDNVPTPAPRNTERAAVASFSGRKVGERAAVGPQRKAASRTQPSTGIEGKADQTAARGQHIPSSAQESNRTTVTRTGTARTGSLRQDVSREPGPEPEPDAPESAQIGRTTRTTRSSRTSDIPPDHLGISKPSSRVRRTLSPAAVLYPAKRRRSDPDANRGEGEGVAASLDDSHSETTFSATQQPSMPAVVDVETDDAQQDLEMKHSSDVIADNAQSSLTTSTSPTATTNSSILSSSTVASKSISSISSTSGSLTSSAANSSSLPRTSSTTSRSVTSSISSSSTLRGRSAASSSSLRTISSISSASVDSNRAGLSTRREGETQKAVASPPLLAHPSRVLRPRAEPARPASPKDLSSIFSAMSPTSGLARTGSSSSLSGLNAARKGTRKMLSKAQSVHVVSLPSSNEAATAPSTPRALRKTLSMPVTPGSAHSARSAHSIDGDPPGSPTPTRTHSQSQMVGLAPAFPASPSAPGPRRTYGRARLADGTPAAPTTTTRAERATSPNPFTTSGTSPTTDNRMASMFEPVRESYEELRRRYEVDTGDDDENTNNAGDSLARPPLPINDMRSKGENRRFNDEIAFLLEGVAEAASTGVKRNSSLDVLYNMQEDSWVVKMNICGQTEHVFEVLNSARGEDEILEAVCLVFLAILAHNNRGLGTVLQGQAETVMAIAARNVGMESGPLDATYKGKVTPAVQRLRNIATKVWPEQGALSTRRTASLLLAQACGETGWPLVEMAVAQLRVTHAIMEALSAEIGPLRGRLDLFAKGLDLLPSDGSADLVHLDQCLQALSDIASYSVDECEALAHTDGRSIGDILDGVVVMTTLALSETDGETRRRAAQWTLLSLKLLTRLVGATSLRGSLLFHKHDGLVTTLGRILLQPESLLSILDRDPTSSPDAMDVDMEGNEDREVPDTDEIILRVLAVLGSVDASNTAATTAVATTPVSASRERSDTIICRAADAKPLATVLTAQYNEYAERADEALAGYLQGYIGFLLAKLIASAPKVSEPLILPLLPGASRQTKLQGLYSVLEDLHSVNVIAHHKLRGHVLTVRGGDGAALPDEEDVGLQEAMRALAGVIEHRGLSP